MNKKGLSQVGVFTPDNLISGNRHPVDICHVVIKKGQKLDRGTVLEEDAEEKGKYVIRGTRLAAVSASEPKEESADTPSKSTEAAQPEAEAEYILAEAVDASEEDTVAPAYCAGEFAENALIVKEGYKITENDRKVLRNASIFLKTIMM